MRVLEQNDWLRLSINQFNKYSIEMKLGFLFWRKWHKVTFGPYGPYKVGFDEFSSRDSVQKLYAQCLLRGKLYTMNGI